MQPLFVRLQYKLNERKKRKRKSDSACWINVLKNWCGPKVGTQEENMEHGLEVTNIYQ